MLLHTSNCTFTAKGLDELSLRGPSQVKNSVSVILHILISYKGSYPDRNILNGSS